MLKHLFIRIFWWVVILIKIDVIINLIEHFGISHKGLANVCFIFFLGVGVSRLFNRGWWQL